MDAVDSYLASKPKPAASLLEAFANTAKALQQFGIERVRIVGLSVGCASKPESGLDPEDGTRIITEQEFMREFVFLSRPCIILDAIEEWPARTKWRSDRYIFDLDGRLPLVEQKSSSDEDDEDEEDEEKEEETTKKAEHEADKLQEADGEAEEKAPAPLGPKRFTIALTPNGRADAVTYVLYDDRDVPETYKETVYTGTVARKTEVLLKDHPLLLPDVDPADRAHLRLEKIFMYASEVKITLPELYKLLSRGPKSQLHTPEFIDMRGYNNNRKEAITPVIAYAQMQNNCLNTEFTHVHADITSNIEDFGTRVFGGKPEAGNVWFGVPATVSSMHQDWVENLYPVVRGVKEFIFIPPWEGIFVPKPDIPSASFALDSERCDKDSLTFAFKPFPEKDGTVVPWMDFDVSGELIRSSPDPAAAVLEVLQAHIDDCEVRKPKIQLKTQSSSVPQGNGNGKEEEEEANNKKKLKELHPLVAYVHPGETLYLPAMWLHRVGQGVDETDRRARLEHLKRTGAAAPDADVSKTPEEEAAAVDNPPLPLIAAVNYWYDMSFHNPAVVMLREFGLLL